MAEPWDDSVLINAFNSAISKYKAMHGIAVKNKEPSKDAMECFGKIESDSQVVVNSNEHDVEQSRLSQKEGNGVPSYQDDKLIPHEEVHTGNNNAEEVPAGYNGFADPQSYEQQHDHSASAENCYQCQWNAYYYQAGVSTSAEASCANRLQCQYCGYLNQFDNGTQNRNQTTHTSQTSPDASAFPDIIKAAVAEALKAADGQNSNNVVTESSQTQSSFSDVAAAWFLAGFHTSRYLSQSK